MEQTIKINVPEGKVAKYNEQTQTREFIDKESIRSKSWNEFIQNHPKIGEEYYIDQNGMICDISYANRSCSNNLETKEDAEGILALIKLTRLHDEWVGNWKQDFVKYSDGYSIITYGCGSIYIYSTREHRLLTFPTEEMAIEFRDCFRNLIEKAKRFI